MEAVMVQDPRRRALGLAYDPANDTIDDVRRLLELERQLNAKLQRENEILLRDLLQAKAELAERGLNDAFAAAPSPSALRN
jgi:hypothetical protein